MIGLSRSFRKGVARAALAASLAYLSASAISCNIGAGCNGSNCGRTLTLAFEGDLSPGGGPYDGGISDSGAPPDAIEIDLEQSTQTKPTFVPSWTCWLILGAQRQVVCDQGSSLYITTTLNLSADILQLRVTMSMNGQQLSQQTITPTYTTRPCGCGDGTTASSGTVIITLPSS